MSETKNTTPDIHVTNAGGAGVFIIHACNYHGGFDQNEMLEVLHA